MSKVLSCSVLFCNELDSAYFTIYYIQQMFWLMLIARCSYLPLFYLLPLANLCILCVYAFIYLFVYSCAHILISICENFNHSSYDRKVGDTTQLLKIGPTETTGIR